jgi:hypothetical protein
LALLGIGSAAQSSWTISINSQSVLQTRPQKEKVRDFFFSLLTYVLVYVYSIRPDYSFELVATPVTPFKPPTGNGKLRGGCTLFGSKNIVTEVLIVGFCPTFSPIGHLPTSFASLTHFSFVGAAAVYIGLMLTSRTATEIPVPTPSTSFNPSDISVALTTEFNGLYIAPSWFILGQASDQGAGSVTIFRVNINGAAISLDTVILTPDDGLPGDRFGAAVVLYQNTSHLILCVGADRRNGTGAVYVYVHFVDEPTSSWHLATILTPAPRDGVKVTQFGGRISHDDLVFAIGAIEHLPTSTSSESFLQH